HSFPTRRSSDLVSWPAGLRSSSAENHASMDDTSAAVTGSSIAFSRVAAHAVAVAPVPTLVRAASCMPGAGVQTGGCADVTGARDGGVIAAAPDHVRHSRGGPGGPRT